MQVHCSAIKNVTLTKQQERHHSGSSESYGQIGMNMGAGTGDETLGADLK